MIKIAGGILLAAAVLAIVQSRTGAQIVAVLIVLGILGVVYAIFGWFSIGYLGMMAVVVVLISWHENRKRRAYLAGDRTVYPSERKDEP